MYRRDLSWGWMLVDSIGIRRQVLTTKYSIVYMEKEAWPEKKDFLQEQERAMKGPYAHPRHTSVCLSSLPRLLAAPSSLFSASLVVLWLHCLEPGRHP